MKTFCVYRYEGRNLGSTKLGEVKARTAREALSLYFGQNGGPSHDEQIKSYAIGKPRISDEMAHVLVLAGRQGADIEYVPLVDGKGSQSRTVGRGATIGALKRHALL